MLTATRGFNHGPDGARVEAGDVVPADALTPQQVDDLVAMGALEETEDPTPEPASAPTPASVPRKKGPTA